MGLFIKSKFLFPPIHNSLKDALSTNPAALTDLPSEAVDRTSKVVEELSVEIQWDRLIMAIVIWLVLLVVVNITALYNLADISKGLMTSFQSFSGLLVGLIGGELAARH
jgi:hypothetical protein